MSKPKSENTIMRGDLDEQNPGFIFRRATAQDNSITFEALGVLTYLLSKPGDWKVTIDDLRRQGGIGRDKARKILKALMEAGYVGGHELIIESPGAQFKYSPYLVYADRKNNPSYSPVTEFPSTEVPSTENTSLYSSTDSDKETENTETTSGASAPTVAHEGQSDGVKGETVPDAGKDYPALYDTYLMECRAHETPPMALEMWRVTQSNGATKPETTPDDKPKLDWNAFLNTVQDVFGLFGGARLDMANMLLGRSKTGEWKKYNLEQPCTIEELQGYKRWYTQIDSPDLDMVTTPYKVQSKILKYRAWSKINSQSNNRYDHSTGPAT